MVEDKPIRDQSFLPLPNPLTHLRDRIAVGNIAQVDPLQQNALAR